VDNPLDQLSTLMAKLAELSASVGLELQGFAVMPNPDPGGPHLCQAILALDPAKVFTTDEDKATDKAFQEIAMRQHADEQKSKIEEARAAAIKSFEEMTGETVEGELPSLDEPESIPAPIAGAESVVELDDRVELDSDQLEEAFTLGYCPTCGFDLVDDKCSNPVQHDAI